MKLPHCAGNGSSAASVRPTQFSQHDPQTTGPGTYSHSPLRHRRSGHTSFDVGQTLQHPQPDSRRKAWPSKRILYVCAIFPSRFRRPRSSVTLQRGCVCLDHSGGSKWMDREPQAGGSTAVHAQIPSNILKSDTERCKLEIPSPPVAPREPQSRQHLRRRTGSSARDRAALTRLTDPFTAHLSKAPAYGDAPRSAPASRHLQ